MSDPRPTPVTPRHQFLRDLHDLLRPKTYLEIGVQRGWSLSQANGYPTVAIGVDPHPMVEVHIEAPHTVYQQTSDEFFTGVGGPRHAPYDLAFIDGMHLVEFALRDFIGVERFAQPDGRTLAVFDDVLPYSASIAGREPLPGDWAGDVWKIWGILDGRRPDLTCILVDVAPTGALVVLGLDPTNTVLTREYDRIVEHWTPDSGVTADAVATMHRFAVGPVRALDLIAAHLDHHKEGTTA